MLTHTRLSSIFVLDQDEARLLCRSARPRGPHRRRSRFPALATDDPQTMYDAMVAKGVDITDEISVRDYGTDFGIRDPFGNRLRIGRVDG